MPIFFIVAGIGFLFLLKMGADDAPPLPNGNGTPSLPPATGNGGASGGKDDTAEVIAGAAGSVLAVLIPALMTPIPAGTAVVVVSPPIASVASSAASAALSASLTATLVVVIVVIVIIITVSIIVSVIEGNALYLERFAIFTRQNFQYRQSQEELFGPEPDYTSQFTNSGSFPDGAWFKSLPALYPTLIVKPVKVGDPSDFAVNTFRDAGGLQGIVDRLIPWQRRILSVEVSPDNATVVAVTANTNPKSSVGNSR